MKKTTLLFAGLLVAGLGLTGCANDTPAEESSKTPTATATATATAPEVTVTITAESNRVLIGREVKLNIAVTGTESKPTVTVDDTTKAEIVQKGPFTFIKGKAAGEVKVTATAGGKSASVTLTVAVPEGPEAPELAEGVFLTGKKTIMDIEFTCDVKLVDAKKVLVDFNAPAADAAAEYQTGYDREGTYSIENGVVKFDIIDKALPKENDPAPAAENAEEEPKHITFETTAHENGTHEAKYILNGNEINLLGKWNYTKDLANGTFTISYGTYPVGIQLLDSQNYLLDVREVGHNMEEAFDQRGTYSIKNGVITFKSGNITYDLTQGDDLAIKGKAEIRGQDANPKFNVAGNWEQTYKTKAPAPEAGGEEAAK